MNTDLKLKLQDERSLGYLDIGDKDGTPIIFLHGWPSSRLAFLGFDELGKKLNARIIAIDRPGIGISSPDSNGDEFNFAQDLKEFIIKLNLKDVILIGVSGGGPYVLIATKVLGNLVKTYAISQGLGMIWKQENLNEYQNKLTKLHWSLSSKSSLVRQLMWGHYLISKSGLMPIYNKIFLKFNKSDSDFMNHNSEAFYRDNSEAYRQGAGAVIKDLTFYTKPWPIDLNSIKQKIYLYHGSDDTSVPVKMAIELDSLLPNSELKIFEGTGHFVIKKHCVEILKELLNKNS